MTVMPHLIKSVKQRPLLVDDDKILLSDLNKNVSRMVDTYIYNYPALVRDNPEPFAQATGSDETPTSRPLVRSHTPTCS